MIILSNDYLANIPGSRTPAKGGPANFAKRFKVFLSKKNHRWIGLVFKFSHKTQPTNSRQLAREQKNSYHLLTIPARLSRKFETAKKELDSEKYFSKQIKAITNLLKKVQPDVVFLNGYALSNWLILKAAQKGNFPVAIQHAGIWTKELEMYKDFYSPAGRRMMQRMEQEISSIAAAEIFLNDWSRRYYSANVIRPDKKKTRIIPLPLDFKNYSRPGKKTRKTAPKIFNIGLIARWDRIKNHEAVAKLAEQARKMGLPWKFHSVTIIPDTPKKKELKKLYKKNIDIIPLLNQQGIKRFCQKMDLLILPSHFDVSPNVVLEAAACGTPVAISSNVGFVDDFKKYGAKDWIVDFNNTKAAVKRIIKLAGVPMSRKFLRVIKTNHDSKKVFNAYIGLFKKIIKEKR